MASHGKNSRGPRRQATPKRRPTPRPAPRPPVASPPPGPLRLGAVPGATPGKWIDTWAERMPHTALEYVQLAAGDAAAAISDGEVDAVIARLPVSAPDVHVIPLYREVPVVVCAADSHLTAADELTMTDLAGEVLLIPRDDVLSPVIPGTTAPVFGAPADTAEAIATVAAGVGIVVVPMSLARLHHRKDVAWRPLTDGPESPVGLVWPMEDPSPLVDVFIGIVRGRSANSSRS